MSILVNADEHREEILKAAHRRAESTLTATYGHKAEINQHARGGGVRTAGSSTNVSIGNQRTMGGNGAASAASHRGLVKRVKVSGMSGKGKLATGAALAGAGAFGVAHHRKNVEKSRNATVASGAAGAAAGGAIGAGAGHLLAEASKVGAHSKAGRIMRAKGAVGTGAALGLTAAGTAAGVARLRRKPVEKSAFGVELAKALGDDNSVRGAVRGDYTPPAVSSAVKAKKIKLALGPAKSALLAAAKK